MQQSLDKHETLPSMRSISSAYNLSTDRLDLILASELGTDKPARTRSYTAPVAVAG